MEKFKKVFTEEEVAESFVSQSGGEIIVRYDYDDMRGKVIKQFEVRY